MNTCYFVTGNDKKWKEIQEIFGVDIFKRSTIDLPELQGESLQEIAIEKAKVAYRAIQSISTESEELCVIVEDTALCFDALGGDLPGAYIKWFLGGCGPEGLCRLLDGFGSDNRGARAICTIALARSESEVHVFQGITKGKIALHPQVPEGKDVFGWDPVFVPVEGGGVLSYAEMSSEDKNAISHRSRALSALREYLKR